MLISVSLALPLKNTVILQCYDVKSSFARHGDGSRWFPYPNQRRNRSKGRNKVRRWDIRGRRILETQEKYYFEDFGLKNTLLGYSEDAIAGLLENVVFLELQRRGYEVFIGQGTNSEVDFIARRPDETAYFRVMYLLASSETIEREFSPLLKIRDNFP